MFFFCDLSKKNGLWREKNLSGIKFVNIKCKKNLASISKKKIIIDNTCSIDFENLIGKNNKIINFKDPIYF